LGILGVHAPLAQALLCAAENEEVEFTTAQGPRTVTVLSIERTRDLTTISTPTPPSVLQPALVNLQTALVTSNTLAHDQPTISSSASLSLAPISMPGLLTMPTDGVLPYERWRPRPVPDPHHAEPVRLVPEILDIVSVEGPILSRRVFQLYARAASIQRLRREVASGLSLALDQAIREGRLIVEADRVINGEQQWVLRTPEQASVLLRKGGDRSLDDIPLTEIAAAMTYISAREGFTSQDELFRSCLSLFGLKRLTENVRQTLETVWRRSLGSSNLDIE